MPKDTTTIDACRINHFPSARYSEERYCQYAIRNLRVANTPLIRNNRRTDCLPEWDEKNGSFTKRPRQCLYHFSRRQQCASGIFHSPNAIAADFRLTDHKKHRIQAPTIQLVLMLLDILDHIKLRLMETIVQIIDTAWTTANCLVLVSRSLGCNAQERRNSRRGKEWQMKIKNKKEGIEKTHIWQEGHDETWK